MAQPMLSFVVTALVAMGLVLATGMLLRRRWMVMEAERRRREAAIERKFRRMIEHADDAIFSFTPRGLIATWNPGAERMTGYMASEAIGSNVGKLVAPEFRGHLPRLLRRIALRGQRELVEVPVERRDGQRIELEVSAWPDLDGQRPVIEAIARDVSARKRAERELNEAKERAEQATRAKAEFLANMSHEIRTPLNGVLGMNALLLDTQLTSEQRLYAGSVKNCGASLLALLNSILDYSKIEAGKLRLERTAFSLRDSIDEIARLFGAAAAEKGLKLTCVFEGCDQRPIAIGDPLRVRQIVSNYVNNAIKFTAAGSVAIETRLTRQGGTAAILRIAVRDTGIGLTPDEIRILFQKFQQADAATTRQFGGTGLGLAISKELAELMGGSAGVESLRGAGSTFWVELPIDVVESGPAAGDAPVLLVEDNLTNQRVALAILSKRGLKVETAVNGEQAVAKWRESRYRVIFMDCQMPVMDGYEATRLIRTIEGDGPRTPIIALTANASPADRELCMAAGMDDYLTKPLDLGELDRVVELWLGAVPGCTTSK